MGGWVGVGWCGWVGRSSGNKSSNACNVDARANIQSYCRYGHGIMWPSPSSSAPLKKVNGKPCIGQVRNIEPRYTYPARQMCSCAVCRVTRLGSIKRVFPFSIMLAISKHFHTLRPTLLCNVSYLLSSKKSY